MNKSNHASLTVYFENPFWVGVFERVEDGNLSVCKVTFGSEPKDYEIADFVLHHYCDLKFSPAVKVKVKQSADNPKRRKNYRAECFCACGNQSGRQKNYPDCDDGTDLHCAGV